MNRVDAIVVGGGPAGSSAAIRLAGAGARVLVVDKSSFPRDKPCGDGLFPEAIRLVEELGVDLGVVKNIDRVVTKSMNGSDEAGFELRGSYPGAVVPRQSFDNALIESAARAGAWVCERSTVQELVVDAGVVRGVTFRTPTGGLEKVKAPVTILAEGSCGSLRSQAPVPVGATAQVCFAARRYWLGVDFARDDACFEMHFPLEANGIPIVGYGWVFPVGDGMANVGAGYFCRPSRAPNLRALVEAFERKLATEDPRFANAEPIGRMTGAPIRIGGSARSSHAPGILLVGDAAGVANPFTGEGISQALTTGGLAATAALDHIEKGAGLAEYATSLVQWNRTYDRLSNRLAVAHRGTSHLARDIIPMFRRSSAVARSVFRMLESEVRSTKSSSSVAATDSIENLSTFATQRAIELASRERPFSTRLIEEMLRLPSAPPSLAAAYFATRASLCGLRDLGRSDQVIARALELLRVAAYAIDSLDIEQLSSEPDARGGDWAEAYFTLGVSDRVLARIFAQTAQLESSTRIAVSDEIASVFLSGTERAMNGEVECSSARNEALVAAAVRIALLESGSGADDLARIGDLVSGYARSAVTFAMLVDQIGNQLSPREA